MGKVAVSRLRSAVTALAAFWLGIAPALAQPSCADFAAARDRLYATYIAMVANDLRAIPAEGDHNAAIRDLTAEYTRRAQTGDGAYHQKLIGLGIFLMAGSNSEPADATFTHACDLAQQGPMVLEPLTCAAIALDGARRFVPGNKELAQRMLKLAHEKIATDRYGDNARRFVEENAPPLQACASE
jgi:hypothetical protein